MIDFINANTYEDMSDYLLVPQDGNNFTTDFLRKGGVIFAKTDYVPELFMHLRFAANDYVLVTHHSDLPITKEMFDNKPSCIKKWFALNPHYEHPDLVAIPYGLSAHTRFSHNAWSSFDINWFDANVERLRNKEKITDTVYCNWGMKNITNGYRFDIPELLEKAGIKYVFETGLSFEEYSENMSNYKFVISPPGNMPQSSTTWEALHYGCTPIVIDNPLYDNCEGLPIIRMKNYGSLTDRYISCNGYGDLTYDILNEHLNQEFSDEKMYLEYWKNLIRSHLN